MHFVIWSRCNCNSLLLRNTNRFNIFRHVYTFSQCAFFSQQHAVKHDIVSIKNLIDILGNFFLCYLNTRARCICNTYRLVYHICISNNLKSFQNNKCSAIVSNMSYIEETFCINIGNTFENSNSFSEHRNHNFMYTKRRY